MTSDDVFTRNASYEIGLYARQPLAIARGHGMSVWDVEGKRYLDFFAGVAVNGLGHCHPAVVEAIRRQAGELLHVSNHYHTAVEGELAALLCRHSFAERIFLCNSGTEAIEAAMKLARRWGSELGGGRYEILATHGSFHGRTFGALTATGQERYHRGYFPLLPGVRLVPYDDLAAMEAAVAPETVAIMVEPIQGEGGVVVPSPGYLRGLRALADRRNLLLILDEIQTGMGRTGTLFAYEQADAVPDLMALAKALGGGVPIGALCTSARVAEAFTPGAHGTTFGGNPLACAAAVAALGTIAEPDFLAHVVTMGRRLRDGLEQLARRHPRVRAVRGAGLMLGIEFDGPGADVVGQCLREGLLINCTADRVLRITPPLIITADEVDQGLALLDRALAATS
ncbi:MAG TPA: aspartate aminotransferase family protein [Candidatus Binatia bacterium]|nr:aspartate aminotransferase family protein [Candidatus Binatia bacterium]